MIFFIGFVLFSAGIFILAMGIDKFLLAVGSLWLGFILCLGGYDKIEPPTEQTTQSDSTYQSIAN